MRCKNCGYQLGNGVLPPRCPQCGANLNARPTRLTPIHKQRRAVPKRRAKARSKAAIALIVLFILLIVGGGALVFLHQETVPSVVGWQVQQAQDYLASKGMNTTVQETYSDDVVGGLVISQRPDGGSIPESHTTVWLEVAAIRQMPDLSGVAQAEATAALDNLKVQYKLETEVSDITPGNIVRASLAPGIAISPGSVITLYVSAPATVPDVIGKSEVEATNLIKQAHLVPQVVDGQRTGSVQAGTVLKQSPAAGTQCPGSTTVELVVALEPLPEPVAPQDASADTTTDASQQADTTDESALAPQEKPSADEGAAPLE